LTPAYEGQSKSPRKNARLTATYQYRDESGKLLFEVLRYEPKGFKQRRPDGNEDWTWDLEGVRQVLYRLPDLKNKKVVWVPEGEKDVEALVALGLTATTNPGGAGKWLDEYSQQLVALGVKSVIVVPDNDEPGERHARSVSRSCFRVGLNVAVLRLPGLAKKGDISQWLTPERTARDLLKLLKTAEPITTEPPPEAQGALATGRGLAPLLTALTEAAGIELFHNPLGEPFAAIPVAQHREVWPIGGKVFQRWLTSMAWRHLQKAPAPDVLKIVENLLAARAIYDGKEETIHLRAASHEGALYYDLADATWRVVKIAPSGWEVLSSSPVRFRRFASTAAQVEPQAGGKLDELWEFINVPNPSDRRLLIAELIAAFVPDIPHPITVLHGDQGSGKTTAARTLRSLIDPSHAMLVRARDEVEFVQALAHHYAPILDNVSHLPDWLSDLLSRSVTGESFSKRQLYTDADDVIFIFRRLIILTGINLIVRKSDLLDRALIIEIKRVPDEKRIEDRKLAARLAAVLPKLFGALLDLLVKAMQTVRRRGAVEIAAHGRLRALGRGRGAQRWPVGRDLRARLPEEH
jgi:hypothetical protein